MKLFRNNLMTYVAISRLGYLSVQSDLSMLVTKYNIWPLNILSEKRVDRGTNVQDGHSVC